VAPRGTYAAGTNYALDDGATYDGSYYRSKIADNIGNQPDTSPTQWEEMISKGDTGAQGIQGETGDQGIQGETGAQGIQGETGANGTGVAPQGTYAAGTTYALNEGVVYDGSYYRSKIADNTGNQPDTSSTQWEKMVAKGVDGINTLSLISADAYRTPLTGIPQPFSNTGNSANIMPDFDNYAGPRLLLSTSSNEPLKMYDYTVPDTTNIKRRIVFEPEKGTGWNGETVIWKSEHKKMTDNVAWTDKIAKDIGTFTAPNAITPTGDTTSGSAVITNISSTTGLAAGMLVTGTGIAADSAIVSIDSGTQITLSENATATGTTITLTCKSVAPQVYEVTTSLATLGFTAGDEIQEVIFVDDSSGFSAGDIAFDRCEITGV
ncbi:MAG: collagen-like protein, partial [Victivallaceae bacterium]|nr:collagen-like protein [Victivallaceae bacterium]